MADYPAAIYSPRTMANRPGVVYDAAKTKVIYAEDFNKDRDEIVAIETELGLNPKGDYADVSERLDALSAVPVFSKYIGFSDPDEFNILYIGNSYFYFGLNGVELACENVTNSYCVITSITDFSNISNPVFKYTFEFPLLYLFNISDSLFVLSIGGYLTTEPEYSSNAAGFRIVNGRVFVFSTLEEELEQTDTVVDLSNGVQYTLLRIEYVYSSYVKFFINNVLVATHIVDVPDGLSRYINLAVKTTVNSGKYFDIGDVFFKIEPV